MGGPYFSKEKLTQSYNNNYYNDQKETYIRIVLIITNTILPHMPGYLIQQTYNLVKKYK